MAIPQLKIVTYSKQIVLKILLQPVFQHPQQL